MSKCSFKNLAILIFLSLFLVSNAFAQKTKKDLSDVLAKYKEKVVVKEVVKKKTKPFCVYAKPENRQIFVAAAEETIQEAEPNDVLDEAQFIDVGAGVTRDIQDVDVIGEISVDTDIDVYRLQVNIGDCIGLAVIGENGLDSAIAITDTDGETIIVNDDSGGASVHPDNSPFPEGVDALDPDLVWISDRKTSVFVAIFDANFTSGGYTLQIRTRRPNIEDQDPETKQIIFLDFDGETIDADVLFGGNANATLSSLNDFLVGNVAGSDWGGLANGLDDEVIDAIIEVVEARFLDLRSVNSRLDVEIRNSRDDADPFGEANVSRVIIGGTQAELGIATIGIAESVDPGNFNTEETAVVLLDTIAGNDALNSTITVTGVDATNIAKAIGLHVGHITAHEIGHYVGLFHVEDDNDDSSIIDQTNANTVLLGAGDDDIFDNADDVDLIFANDIFEPDEGIAIQDSIEFVDIDTAFALTTGPTVVNDSDSGGGCTLARYPEKISVWGYFFPFLLLFIFFVWRRKLVTS